MSLNTGPVGAESGQLSDMMERLDKQAKSKPKLKHFSEAVFFDKVFSTSNLPIIGEKPLLYIIPALKDYIIDLSLIKHYARYQIVDGEGKNLEIGDECCAKGSPLYSSFKNLHVSWNNVTVYDGKSMYNQYVHMLVSTKDVHLPDTLEWYRDTGDMAPGVEHTYDADDPTSIIESKTIWDGEDSIVSFANRCGSWRFGTELELVGPILYDQVFQMKFLRDDIDQRVTLTPAPSELALFTTSTEKTYQLRLMEAHLIVPRFKLMPKYSLPRGSLDYHFVRHELSTHMIASGVQNVQRQLRSGVLPRRVFFALISERAFLGSYHHSPYRYQNFGLKLFQVTSGSMKYPSEPLRLDWSDNARYLECYQWFLINTRSSKKLSQGYITKDMYKDSNFILAVDLTPDLSAGSGYRVEVGVGPLNISMQFETGLSENVVMIMLEEFEASLNCSPHGQIIMKEYPVSS